MNFLSQISVIVPVYKVEKYLDRCIESILAQTFKDFEIILVDDGSPDNCGEMCDEFEKKYSQIRVIHRENGGLSAARNTGVDWVLRNSTSQWITFVDSDDTIHPQMLETLYNYVNKYNVKIGICSAFKGEKQPDSFNKLSESFHEEYLNLDEDGILNLCKNTQYFYWIACGKLLHRSIIEKYPFTEGRIYEDNSVVYKWLHEAQRIVITNEPFYFYYVNLCGITKTLFTEKNLDLLLAFKEQIDFYHSLGYEKMTSHMATYFFEISANLHYRAKTENAKELIPQIKKKEKEIKTLYTPYIKLNAQQQLYYYERTSKPMFYITRLKNKLGLLK